MLAGLAALTPAASNADTTENATTEVRIDKPGEVTLDLRDGNHRVTATLSLAPTSSGWPEGFVIGGSSKGYGSGLGPYRIVSSAELRVDGCRIDQPFPPIAGFALPSGASLAAVDGRWELSIGGSDGAESYGVTYRFDERRVLERELGWGPWSETTRYDIAPDPEVFPQDCAGAD